MDSSAYLLLSVLLSASSAVDPSSVCNEIMSLDCYNYKPADSDESICASNTVNNSIHFNNFCEFSQAKCKDDRLSIVSIGGCSYSTRPHTTVQQTTTQPTTKTSTLASTTQKPTTPINITSKPSATTTDVSLGVFCKNKDVIVCPTSIDLVCGTDGKLYLNRCAFAKSHCDNPNLASTVIEHCRS